VSRRALISVWDKTGVEDFGRGLHELGFRLVSSGGTAAHLAEKGLPVTRVEDVTAAPEMLGGRVKTLHPRIHAGILARRDLEEDVSTLAEHEIEPIDVVCVNLYPFAAVAGRRGVTEEDVVEMIDVGGPSMLRAAAKNFAHVAAVSSADQYETVLAELREHGEVSLDTRRHLAQEAFATTAVYEATIANWFAETEPFPSQLTMARTRTSMPRTTARSVRAATSSPASTSSAGRSCRTTTSPTWRGHGGSPASSLCRSWWS
jgi:phosphoribosylaminoimidazolecarboxamide formyltransferase/IMP cyclohydrolase